MSDFLANTKPIPDDAEWLQTLQGNILKFHGRRHAAHIFFAFRDPLATGAAKATLRRLFERRFITSAREQERQRAERHRRLEAGEDANTVDLESERFGSLLLTAEGYRALGAPDVEGHFDEPEVDGLEVSFAQGMGHESARRDLRDPARSAWEPKYRRRIDGLLLLAHANEGRLDTAVDDARALLADTCVIRKVEMGHVIRNRFGQGSEHFGFADGRSQPLYLRSDFKDDDGTIEADGSAAGSTTSHWKPFERLERVLVRDPYVAGDETCYGSFFVFRKLEQNVRGFRTALVDLAGQLSPENDVDRAGALVVGRFEDGTPLESSPRPGTGRGIPANDFVYRTDIPGRRCPHQAHIRKVNPRGESPTNPLREREHRITRRSLTYGEQVDVTASPETLPVDGRGVLFMCYQASIRRHFAFMQSRWANAPSFPRGNTGTDVLVGQGTRPPQHPYTWPPAHNTEPTLSTLFAQFVQLKGGEFFFAPSVRFFEQLPEG